MYLLVDPIVLCLPEETATSDQIIHFIKHLTAWDKFIRNDSADRFCITAKCYLALLAAGRYPSRDLMVRLIDGKADIPVNGNDVYNACRQIIESACFPSFEEIVELPLKQFDSDAVSLDPNLLERIPPEIQESFRETFGYIAYAKEIDENDIASDLLLLTHPIEEDKIAIDITLLINPDELRHVETDLPIAEKPQDLLRLRSLTDIWEDTRQAIDLAKDRADIDTDSKLYTVGSEFNKSLQEYQFPTHPPLLDKCFQKIAQLITETLPQREQRNTREHKPLFKDQNTNGVQRQETVAGRDWEAWRLRITKGKQPYRLHYWYSKDGGYVLSNVINKNSMDICPINENIVSQIR